MKFRFRHRWRRIADAFERDPAKVNIYPHRDWLAMLAVSFVLLTVIAGLHYYVFVQINTSEIFQVNGADTSNKQRLEQEHLEKVLQTYEQKQARFNELRDRGPVNIDPR